MKKGLLLPNKTLENSKIQLSKAVEELPSSLFHFEPWQRPFDMNTSPLRKEKADDPSHLHKYQFDLATSNDVLWKNAVTKPIKKEVF